jgi:hypothetical protein
MFSCGHRKNAVGAVGSVILCGGMGRHGAFKTPISGISVTVTSATPAWRSKPSTVM